MATKLAAAYNSFHVFPSSATLDGKFEVFPFMTACQSKGKTTKQAALSTKGETETCPNISWTDICISAWSRKILRKIKACLFHRHSWMTTAGFQSSRSVFRLHWCKICLKEQKKHVLAFGLHGHPDKAGSLQIPNQFSEEIPPLISIGLFPKLKDEGLTKGFKVSHGA